MKLLKSLSFVCFIILFVQFNNVYSQNTEGLRCGLPAILRDMYAKNPQMELDYHKFVVENNKYIKNNKSQNKTVVYIIPIVFHVIHQYGSENITDAQIINAVAVMNKDYRKLNSDTNDIVPEFKSIAADCRIEFRLATKDLYGNCTNGIDRIYSHKTNLANDGSKYNQWPRDKYLNIWVIKSFETSGVAGYSMYPSAVIGQNAFRDGVILLYNYVGSTGTSNYYNSRTLTHEVGHYLGLSHPWGSTNEPEVACGDDEIKDTPETKGWQHCDLVNNKICIDTVVENVQNFMEYSYCDRMFTADQSLFMEATLNSSKAGRNNLSTLINISYTGADATSLPLCTPMPEFTASKVVVCSGSSVKYNNYSWRATADSYLWNFPGGDPSTSTEKSPTISYSSPGWHNVTLSVSNASGSETKTKTNCIYVTQSWSDIIGPYSENFDNPTNGLWFTENPENNDNRWNITNSAGFSGTSSMALINIITNPTDLKYYDRLGGSVEAFITPSYNLSTTTSARFSFKYSIATRTISNVDITDKLKVQISTNCGTSWTMIREITKLELVNAQFCAEYFVPNINQWAYMSIDIPASAIGNTNVRFRLEYTCSDYSNNVYIDDIGIEGVQGLFTNQEVLADINIYPNPIEENSSFNIAFTALNNTEVIISLSDVAGKEIQVYKSYFDAGNQNVSINIGDNRNKGIYFVKLSTNNQTYFKKLMVL